MRGARSAMSATCGGGDEARLDAEPVGDEAEEPLPLGLVEARVLVTPAVELQPLAHA